MSPRAVYSSAGAFQFKRTCFPFKLKYSITFPAAGRAGETGDSLVVAGSEDSGRKEWARRDPGEKRPVDSLEGRPIPISSLLVTQEGSPGAQQQSPTAICLSSMKNLFFLSGAVGLAQADQKQAVVGAETPGWTPGNNSI